MTTAIPRRRLLRAGLPLLLGVAAFLPLAAQAQRLEGSGRIGTETRPLPAFQGVALAGAIDLVVRQGTPQVVEVQADDNLLPDLETEVTGSGADARLQVRWKRGTSIYNSRTVRVSVTVPLLTSLAASGSGDMLVEAFETPSLAIRISQLFAKLRQRLTQLLDKSQVAHDPVLASLYVFMRLLLHDGQRVLLHAVQIYQDLGGVGKTEVDKGLFWPRPG
jgi:hypothetical protein